MDSLRQRLKELDRDKFEELIFCLLKARHPDAEIRRVQGAGGDEGVDTFMGNLASGCTIWQAKSFPNGIRKSQKEKIKNSLRQAVRNHHPARWILCTCIDLDIKAHAWFQRLAESYGASLKMGLMQASDITSELMHRKTIRDHYFPDAGLNIDELRALITKTNDSTDDELANLTAENAQQYIERLKTRDARFDYEIVISTDRAPRTTSEPVFSINTGTTLINAYARDTQALRDDPVRLHLRFQGTGVDKINEFIKTGRGAHCGPEEITSLCTTLPFPELQHATSFHLGPRASKKPLTLRVTFGSKTESVVYDLITFHITSAGTDEVQLSSTGKQPFTLNVVVRDRAGSFTVDGHLADAPMAAVKKYADALIAQRNTGELQLYDLEDERVLCHFGVQAGNIPVLHPGLVRLINDASIVATAYSVNLIMPEVITEADAGTIAFLKSLLDGTAPDITEITGVIIKEDATNEWVTQVATGVRSTGITLHHDGMTRLFAGIPIHTGPYDVIIDQIQFRSPDQTLEDYKRAPTGAPVTITCIPITPARSRRTNRALGPLA